MDEDVNNDIVQACKDLTARAGACGFEIGYTGNTRTDPRWYAHAQYRGCRVIVEDRPSAADAARALAERLLIGAVCRCHRPVALVACTWCCTWELVGARWEPGCDSPPVRVQGARRGDYEAIKQAMWESLSRNQT